MSLCIEPTMPFILVFPILFFSAIIPSKFHHHLLNQYLIVLWMNGCLSRRFTPKPALRFRSFIHTSEKHLSTPYTSILLRIIRKQIPTLLHVFPWRVSPTQIMNISESWYSVSPLPGQLTEFSPWI